MKIIRRIFCHGKDCGNFELVQLHGNYRWFSTDSTEHAEIIHKTLNEAAYKFDNMYEAFRFKEEDLT